MMVKIGVIFMPFSNPTCHFRDTADFTCLKTYHGKISCISEMAHLAYIILSIGFPDQLTTPQPQIHQRQVQRRTSVQKRTNPSRLQRVFMATDIQQLPSRLTSPQMVVNKSLAKRFTHQNDGAIKTSAVSFAALLTAVHIDEMFQQLICCHFIIHIPYMHHYNLLLIKKQ